MSHNNNKYDDEDEALDIDESTIELIDDDYGDDGIGEVDTDLSNTVIVDNIPVTPMVNYEKLVGVIRKIFEKYGELVTDGLYIPTVTVNGVQQTAGYAFIEYGSSSDAARAISEGNNRALDKSHKLLVNSMLDFDRYGGIQDTYQAPDKAQFEQKIQLTSWLHDELLRDQFVMRYGSETEIYWFDPLRKQNEMSREYKYGGEKERIGDVNRRWTDLYTSWSTNGSYLATFHAPGIVLWGGDGFDKISRFAHTNVAYIDFSPCEKYLVTGNVLNNKLSTNNEEALIVWEIRGAKKLRSFSCDELLAKDVTPENSSSKSLQTQWPILKFSYDDKYCARIIDNAIAVYELPQMQLIDKKTIKIHSVADLVWSPSQLYCAYWVPEQANKPAHAGIIEIPSRKLIREKHLYNVVDIKLYWQESGDYLCVKVIRRKTKTTLRTNLELFRLREKDVPVEVLELDEPVSVFQWERCSAAGAESASRFAIIHGEASKSPSVSIYSVKKNIKKLVQFDQQPANQLFWSPRGSFLVSAGLGSLNGQLTFIDADTQEIVSTNEHFMCNEVDWDPSGRYVMSAVTQPIGDANWRYTMENGYRVFSAHGALLCSVSVEKLYQVLWRPRPSTLLTKEQIQKIKSELKEKYWKKFEAEDTEIQNTQLTGIAQERYQLVQEWKKYRAERMQEYREQAELRRELRHGYASDDDDDYETVEQTVEEELDVQYEVL